MPTSELSDALNPYASQARRAPSSHELSPLNATHNYQLVVQGPPNPHVVPEQNQQWHVSELQNAMVQAEALPPVARTQQAGGPSRMLAELVRIVAATQNAQDAEVKRRLEWEQEQERKSSQKQADMEKMVLDLQSEVMTLRSKLETLSNNPSSTANHSVPVTQFTSSVSYTPQINITGITSPISPVSQPSPFQQPMFVQGSSKNAFTGAANLYTRVGPTISVTQPSTSQFQPQTSQQTITQPGLQSITPDPSPHLAFVEASRASPSSSSRPSSRPSKRHRRRSHSRSSDASDSSSSSSNSNKSRPRKRISHHDTRCYTIHHAMRLHILRMMEAETDRDLPDSHTEGTSLGPSEPVRFVWDKTTKQSVHNARMKTRILEDLKENQRLYKHVDRKEFTKKLLDTAFEQCFVTLRKKFKSQRDDRTAERLKKYEDRKARKSRHLSRRKNKLNNRSEARNKIPTFEHVAFDGALQLDCMSSEESDYESDPNSSQSYPILKTHGYGWRSTRLLRFYCLLDDGEATESSSKGKRGPNKKERRIGPIKDEFILPPSGVATWMISRRWYKASLRIRPDLPHTLGKLISDPPGFDWAQYADLGFESADEEDVVVSNQAQLQLQWLPVQQFQPNDVHNIDTQQQYNTPTAATFIPNYTF